MDYIAYKELLEQTRKWYKTIRKVYCLCLKDYVIFNAKGLRHLRYDGKGKERPISEQVIRLNLLPHVIPLIKQQTQTYSQKKSNNGSKVFITFQGKFGTTKFRVVLIRESSNQTIYFSVMKTR
ncbi:MAG: hypothetical protein WCP09_03630 [Candidatus Taylorbacteria bacterium]